MVLKRETYAKLGDPRITTEIVPHEDKLLEAFGLPWKQIVWQADRERRETLATPGQRNISWILGKDYAMTAEEKISTGQFIGMMPDQTSRMIKRLLPESWKKVLSW